MDLNDVLIILGTVTATAGLWLLSPPLALICLGVWLTVLGFRLPGVALPKIRLAWWKRAPGAVEGGETS